MTAARSVAEARVLGDVPRYELTEWSERFGLVAGITGRGEEPAPGFDLGLWTGEPVGQVMTRWRRFRRALGGFDAFVLAHQVHGGEVLLHEAAAGWQIHEGADGHITALHGTALLVTVADCVPVYVADPATGAIALLHAGWRGTAAGILPRALTMLKSRFNSRVENLVVHCGVAISGPCYEVGSEVMEAVGVDAGGRERGQLDLRGVLAAQATAAGVAEVSISTWCSAADSAHFYSHRRSGGKDGRMVAYLGRPRDGAPR